MRAGALVLAVGLSAMAACGGDDDTGTAAAPTNTGSVSAAPATAASTAASGPAGGDACAARTVELAAGADGGVAPPTPTTDEELLAAVVDTFCSPTWTYERGDDPTAEVPNPAPLTAAEARCVADGLARDLGLARLRELPVGSGPWSTVSFGLGANGGFGRGPEFQHLVRPEAERIVAVFVGCTPSWEQLLIRSVTGGAEQVGDQSAACVAERLDDVEGRFIFAGELDRAYDDPDDDEAIPFAELVRPLEEAFDACLTAEERSRVDWN